MATSECAFYLSEQAVCSRPETIKKVAEVYGVTESNPKQIVEKVKAKVHCDSESCILNRPEVVKTLGEQVVEREKEERFKPYGPGDSTEWFSNFNIDDVMAQWAKKWPHFYNIEFQMIDFEEYKSALSKINFHELRAHKYKSAGVVINTDSYRGGGKHWFALYFDFSGPVSTVEYFNSSGRMPLPEIQDLFLKIKNQFIEGEKIEAEDVDKKVKSIIVSRSPYQEDDYSCGAWSLFYIWSRLNGKSYTTFDKNMQLNDEQMIKFRQFLFRKHE
nr:cysteine protease [Kaumoebavirus]